LEWINKCILKLNRHYRITVKGRVQGVRFRASAQARAHQLNLTGFVKNLGNGDVYMEAEGDADNLNVFIDWCYVGSPLSKVIEVNSEEGELKDYQTFEVKK
jgi:acylphosphatase